MSEHPIQGLMKTAMESIKDMVDVNTIVGDAVQAPDGTVIIPISKVSFGFAAGGGEYSACCLGNEEDKATEATGHFPFAGGSGAGVSINPMAFMVVSKDNIRLMPVSSHSAADKAMDLVPEIIQKASELLKKKLENCECKDIKTKKIEIIEDPNLNLDEYDE